MGEEGKKPEEDKKKDDDGKKVEESKREVEKPKDEVEKKEGEVGAEGEKKENGDGGKGESAAEPPPSPPDEIVMRVYMHCEGCARKVKRSLKGFDGVEEVTTDCRTHKVVVKGKKAAEDPMKVVERVQKKSGRKAELMTPLPPPKPEKMEEKKEEEKPKLEEKKEEPPVISVVLKVHMHCEACAQEIKKRILKMKGVQAADPDLKASQVTVKGTMDAGKLVEYVYKRTGKHAIIVKSEPVDKKPDEAEAAPADDKSKSDGGGETKKAEGGGDDNKPDGEKKDESGGGQGGDEKDKKDGNSPDDVAGAAGAAGGRVLDSKKNEYYYYHPRYLTEYQAYPPQLFSDENPNACSVM